MPSSVGGAWPLLWDLLSRLTQPAGSSDCSLSRVGLGWYYNERPQRGPRYPRKGLQVTQDTSGEADAALGPQQDVMGLCTAEGAVHGL